MKTLTLLQKEIHTGSLILVNAAAGYREDAQTSLVPVLESYPTIQMQRRAAVLLSNLMDSFHGWQHIVPVSGWRAHAEQQQIWDDSVRDSGLDFTQKYVALPGHSEHQTGLAIDLGQKQAHIDFIRPAFPYSGICQIFRDKAADYAIQPEKNTLPASPMNPGIFVMLGFHMPKSWCKIIWSLKNIFLLSSSIVMDNPLTPSFGVGRMWWFRICHAKALIPA